MKKDSIANRIFVERKNKGLSQETLAEKAGINLRTLQRIENGRTDPRGQTLALLATALDKPLEYFTSGTSFEPGKNDTRFLKLLNLSVLFFWIFPFGNIFMPFIIENLKKDHIEGSKQQLKRIVRFQSLWSVVTYGLLVFSIISGIIQPGFASPLMGLYGMIGVAILYLVNSAYIVITTLQIRSVDHETAHNISNIVQPG